MEVKAVASAYEILGIEKNACEEEIRSAYRKMARRWHPDRFPEGPERMWAEQKMTSINIAYHEALEACTSSSPLSGGTDSESEQFSDVRALLEIGQVGAARQALMRIATRNAEWNYLFGAVLLRLGEYEKAVLYFGVAAHQKPHDKQYRTAYMSAEAIRNQRRSKPFLSRVMSAFAGKR
mgnify:FL=1